MSNFDLIQLLQSEDANERETAAKALGKLGNAEVVPALIAALELEPRLEIAKAMVSALGELGDKRAVPALFALIERSEKWRTNMTSSYSVHHLHGIISQALGAIADKDALIEKLHHPNEKVRRIAADALGSIRII